jgi:hypothetical protein
MATKPKVGQIAQKKARWVDADPADFEWAGIADAPVAASAAAPVAAEKPSVARRIGDVGLSLGQGALGSFKSISDFLGADNPVSGGLDDASKFLFAQKSAQSQAATQASMARIKEAEASGSKLDEAQAYLGMLWDQPAEMIAQGVGSFATLGVGKVAQALKLAQAAKAAGVSKDVFLASGAAKQAVEEAAKFGFKTNIGLGAVQGVGAVKGSQFEQTYENARQQGMPEEEARALAAQAQEYGGAGTMQQVLGGVLGGVASATGPIERTLLGAGKKPVQSGVMSSVAKGFGKEFATEGGQGAQERFAGNDAAVDAGVLAPERRMQGVVGQGLMEGTIGGLLGGITGPLEGQAAALDPAVNPAKEAADAIRATEKLPESGALTKAVNAGVEAKAQAVEAGAPLVDEQAAAEPVPEPVDDPVRDQILALPDGARQDALRAYAVLNRPDAAKGVLQLNRKLLDRLLAENAPPPVLGERLTDTDMGSMLGGGGMAGRADPLAGALGMNNEAQAAAITNVANVAERRPPMPASDAARMLDEARNRGLDLAVAEHPAGGFVLVPPNWVTPDMAAQGEARLNETIARMQQADAAPVERAPRTRTDGVGLDLQTDPVQNYLDNLRGVNTPAARAYVRDFDAGRITPADVQQRMQAEKGLTPEQRLARAASEAPAQTDPVADRLRQAVSQRATPAPTDILNPAGEPFKTRMAADRAAKKTPGAVVPVAGGFVVRPQEPVNVQDVPQAPQVPQAAPAISQPGQAPQAVGAQPAGPAAGVPAAGAGAVEAAGVEAAQAGPVAQSAPADFWSFAKSKGFTPGQIKVGTPEHAALKAEYDSLKGGAAPVLPPLEAPQDVNMQNRDRGRAASVVQMSDIARNPDYMRLGPSRTPDSGAPMVFAVGDDLKDIAPDAYGREDVAVMSDGQRVPFRYAVVDATKVNPSNFADGRRNELFDSTVPGTLKALNNGRTAGIRGAHELGTAGEYVQAMQADTPMHGISPDIIARTPNAALVRVYSDSDNTAGMAAKSQGQGLGMSPAELARQDAPLMDSSVLAVYQPGEVTSAANRDFVRAFIGKLQGAGQDVAGMMTADGQLSQDGRKRIQAALMQAAYGDSDIVEEMFDSTDTDIKAIGEALKTVAGQWANMRDSARLNAINPQTDITDNLLQAIGLIRKARRDGMSLYDLVNQPDLMTGETPAEMTVGMLRLFYSGQYLTRAIGKEKLTQHLADYVQGAMTTSADAGMFGDVVTAGDILATIVNRLNEGQGNAEAQPQEGRGQPAGSVDTGRGPGEGQPGIGGQAAGEGGPGSNQDRGGQPGQNAQAQAQQQDGQGNPGGQEGNGAQAAAAPGGQRGEPEAQAAGVKAEKPKKAAKPKTAKDSKTKAEKPAATPSDAAQQLERDFRTFPTQILNNLLERGEAAKLYKAASVKGSSAFDGLAMDEKAAAYVKYVEQGGKPVEGLPKDYNAWAASQERDAVVRRLRSDRVVRQENGKPFKSKISAQQFQERYDLTGTHEVVQAAGGFELRQLSIAAQAELKRKAEGRENYTEAQAAVAAEMGIGVNEDGEWDVTDAQFDELERRTAARLKGEKAAPPTEPEPLLTAQTPEEIVARQDAAEAAKREQEAADRKAREQERQAEERKRIAQASERAADNFELGQDALDSLTGQTNIFDMPAEAPAPAPAPAVSANTVFTEDAAAKARERLKKKLGRLNSGIDPEMMIDGITLAGYHIEKGARTFAAYASAMLADLGDGVRPYLKSWYMGVKYDPRAASLDGMDSAAAVESADVDAITAQENQDAAGANGSVEPDRGDAAAEPAMGDAVPADARGATRPAGQAGGQATGEGRGRQPRGAGVPTGGPAAGGNRGDFLLPGGNAAADAANVSAGSDFSERGSDIGVDGVSIDPIPAAQVDAVAQTGNDKLSKLERQRAAEKVPVKPGDLDNIKATLPYLLAGQQEDVKKAEDRFAVPDGYGMLFTNGTGTGKTFTGLGVVKRMQRQGKTNTLIVVPDDKIAADWVESGEPLGLKITKLKDTQDAGKGIVITTYANLGENDALARRQWDLVVADESHTLMQSADGKVTTYLANLRAITHHPDGASQRHTMLNRDDLNRQRDLTARIEGNNKILNNLDTMDAMMESVRQENAKLQREADALAAKLREAREAVQAEVDGMQGAKRARLLALSATPFAYEFTVDWANGYLFDYNEGQPSDKTESRGYNQGDNRERFFMQHFGYSMRYNKLTKPDPAKVDTGLLQRNFNGWLRKKGSLSARMLDVPADYDRRFVLVDSGIGNQIDEALNWVSEMAREDANKNGYSALRDVISKKFDFLSRRYLLEAIKATEVIPIVRQHLGLGRKVVVFHDYKKGGGFNPFDIEVPRTLPEDFPEERKADFEAYKEALTEFRSRFKRLVNAPLSDLDSPIEVFKRELPDTMLVNGDEKKADLLERYKRFQDDASGPQVMLVQSAKNKGWSGHDTTGKHQRVLINLGQPTAPTLAIQQEGRIYRTGQVSDAIMRYLNTGTNWEKWTFATTIAGRASTAENLGMGEQARALKDSFISAFEESDTYPPGHEGEGKGGKERDQMANAAITAYDRAKTYYWATQKKNSKTKAQEGVDYFATPEPVGFKMAEWLGLRGGESSLEPSAGHGAIARWLPEISNRTVIEPSTTLRARLAMAMDASKDRIIDGTFEDHNIVNKYDGIAMNPPFGVGGKTAIEHLAKAVKHLRDGGRIAALIPTGPAADKRFDQWMYGETERLSKPIYKHPTLGEIHRGDTVTVEFMGRAIDVVADRVDRAASGDFLRAPGEDRFAGKPLTLAKSIKPGPRVEKFRPADGVYMVAEIKLPQVTFERAGTAVVTRIVILEKQSNKDKAPNARPAIDLSDTKDIGQLFDEIEDISMPPRAMSAEQEAAAQAEREQAEREAKKAERAQAKVEGKPTAPKAPKAANPDAVGTVDRNGAEIITHTTGKGKVLTGIVRTDLLKDEAQKIDPFTFRKDGGWFIREVYLKPEGDSPMMSRGAPGAMNETTVRQVADTIAARWAQAPTIIVVPNMQDMRVPEAARLEDARQRAGGATGSPRGFYYRGQVYLVADGLTSVRDAAETLFHEALGHHGLRAMFGKDLDGILDQIAMARPDLMKPKAEEYGKDLKVQKQRREVAEEVLAELSQVRPDIGFVKRAIAVIRTWLRENVPYFNNLKLTDAEIVNNYIIPARGFVERGRAATVAAPEVQGGFEPAFSLGEDAGKKALAEFAKADELFALPKSGKDTVAGIAADIDSKIAVRVTRLPGETMYTLNHPDFGVARITERTGNPYGPSLYGYNQVDGEITDQITERPGENPEDVDPRTGDVWLDVSLLKPGQGGEKVYAIATNYAHNTGKIFIGDPAGLSTIALRRRLEQMLSSALKFGTTAHLAPHPDQVRGGDGVPPLRWVYGDDVGNVERMIAASVKALDNAMPTSKLIAYDPDRGFYRTDTGRSLARGQLAFVLKRSASEYRLAHGAGAAGQAGWRTIARAALFRHLQTTPIDGARQLPERGSLLARAGEDVSRLGRGRDGGEAFGADERIFYSRTAGSVDDGPGARIGAAIKSITVSNVKQRAGFKLTDYLGIGLQALGRRQIVDIYGDLVPLAEYNRLVQQMEADKNEGGAEADQLVTRWSKLQDESKLADLMHDATLAQIDPAEDLVDGDDKGKYLELRRKYNLLSDDAKKVYADTRDSYKSHHAKVRSAIKERIERSEIKGERKAALLKQMDDEFFKAVKGVYFPLARFGQYAVTVKGPDGKVESVSRAETKAEAEALRNNLLSAFPRDKGFTVGRVMLSKDFIADRDAVGRGFMTELYQVLDKQDMDAAQRAELEDTLGQLYLSSLPDLSWAKHGIHRKGTPGFSQDARRAFAQNMFHGARYLAKLRYSDLMQDELAAMQRHVDDWREVEDFDQNSAQRVVDEMNKRHESLMNPKSNPVSTALTSLGFVFHLGLSPASAMVNLSQTALVAYPIMGAKWGYGKASAALLKASAEAAKGKNDITASLNADELAAYNEAVRAGTIDVTMAHDLAGIAQGEDMGVMWKIRPVMRWASFLFHHAERFNRQVTFVAAYRLAREAGADHKAAFEQATKATYDGHFDYGAANRPRFMQGNVAKVLLLFKQYGQNMVYTLARNAQQAIKGESPEVRAQARKALGGLLATHAAAAGVLGLPMVTTLLAAASMIGGDDDEPWDAKVALQNMLADTLGQKPAEVLAHGLSRLTPWDISGRVGLDRLIFPDVQEGLEGQRLGEAAMAAALGPVAGIGINVLKGLQDMSQGQYARGLEAMMPAALRGPIKAIRYESEGVQDKTGVVIQDEVSLAGVAGQFLGFSPSEVRNATEGKSAIYQQDRALGERRQELLAKAARATMAKDAEARAEAMQEIQRFNQKNPGRRITPLNVLQSVRNRQKRIDQAEGGVYLPKSRRDAMEAGRFAVVD